MALKIEVFTSLPPCSGGRMVLRLMDQIKKEYGDKVEIEVFKGPTDKAKEYGLKGQPCHRHRQRRKDHRRMPVKNRP